MEYGTIHTAEPAESLSYPLRNPLKVSSWAPLADCFCPQEYSRRHRVKMYGITFTTAFCVSAAMATMLALASLPPHSLTLQMNYYDWDCNTNFSAGNDAFCTSTSSMPFCDAPSFVTVQPSCDSPMFMLESRVGGTLTITPIFNKFYFVVGITMRQFNLVKKVGLSNFRVVNSQQHVTMTIGDNTVNITTLGNVNFSSLDFDISVFSDPSIVINIDYPSPYEKNITTITFDDATLYFSLEAYTLLTIAMVWLMALIIIAISAIFVLVCYCAVLCTNYLCHGIAY